MNVYRRALSGQPDGSVVMISTGFLGNLSALLDSPADAISPLGGRDLIARKVRRLVVMGGGYPSRPDESNLSGNPAPAQNVANNWPTKVVWSGYEVGDPVHTGQTISRVHPTWSPLRVAYEALVSPGNWYFAYDPATVYHAIRPADPLLTDTGPGKNAVDATGGNVFTSGAGNQYYVRLGDATALAAEIEKLLDTLPARADLPAIGHVFVVMLENGGPAAFAPTSPAPYLAQTLTSQGAFLPNYHGVTHDSLGNYLGLVSGQGSSVDIQADCAVFKDFTATGPGADGQLLGNGCVYPASVQTLPDQLVARGMTWKGYMEDMGNFPSREPPTCGHPPLNTIDPADTAMIGDQYATRHNPFVYFHSIVDAVSTCDQNDVPLSRMSLDLASVATTPNFSLISPNLCNDGHDDPCIDGTQGGLVAVDAWLRQWVPVITGSPAFKKDGLLLVLFDEAYGSAAGCCNQAQFPNVTNNGGPIPGLGGGRLGAVALSPFIRPGTVAQTPYNHFSTLRTLESTWELPLLGYAASPNPGLFGRDVFSG